MIDTYLRGENMDKFIGVAAVSTPFWLHYYNVGIAILLGIGGVTLLWFRIAKARQDYLKAKEEREAL